MNLEEYLSLVRQLAPNFDIAAAMRFYNNYRKECPEMDMLSARRYIENNLPDKNAVALCKVLEEYGDITTSTLDRAQRWLRQNKEPVQETLCGPCITVTSADMLSSFLENAVSVPSEFNQYCFRISVEPTPAIFSEFIKQYRHQFVYTRYHPFSLETHFWLGRISELQEMFSKWYITHTMNTSSDIEGYVSIGEAADHLNIRPATLLDWLQSRKEMYTLHNNRCLISLADLISLQQKWQTILPITEVLQPLLEHLPPKMRVGAKTDIILNLQKERPFWVLPDDELPQQRKNILYTAHPVVAEQALTELIYRIPALPLGCLKDLIGIDYPSLRQKCGSGAIEAEPDESGVLRISINERRRIQTIHKRYIVLDDIVQGCLEHCTSKFLYKIQYHRVNLISFCDKHDWWDIDYVRCKELPVDGKKFGVAVLQEDAEEIKERINFWLQGYQQPPKTKFRLFMNLFIRKYPKTAKKLLKYEEKVHPADVPLVDMVQLLYLVLPSELSAMDDNEIEKEIVDRFSNEATLAACHILSHFLLYGDYSKRKFIFSGTGATVNTSAYSVKDFSVMVSYIVNDAVIEHEDLINKAVSNKRYADLWLYIALHVYASWRSTDYIRMIAPLLPYAPEIILEKVQHRELTSKEAISVAEYFIASNQLLLNAPNKTKGTTGVPKLYFYCPESCLEAFGTILAIATAHYLLSGKSESFVMPVKDWLTIKRFFGDHFLAACGNRAFSGRRANKALLQSVEYAGREDGQLPPLVAYHLASIMRSHKISYGGVSETTDIYLHDAAFSGLTPEFVIYQMWERGVCSFVVDAMLDICYGEQYSRLTVAQQTKAIGELGLTPTNISDTLACVQKAMDQACDTVLEVFQSKETISAALKAIALGHGVGKELDAFCVLKAAGKGCVCKSRLNCMGCQYEIKTKALLVKYAANHRFIADNSEGLSEKEKERRKYLYTTLTWPAMVEILSHMDSVTNEGEFSIYKNLIKEVSQYGIAGNGTS